jgi:hypothetical protein
MRSVVTPIETLEVMSPFRRWANSAAEMRRIYLNTPGGKRFGHDDAQELGRHHDALLLAGADADANETVAQLRDQYATPLTYPQRHSSIASTRRSAWLSEEELIVRDAGVMASSDLSSLRRRAEKDLARATMRNSHPAMLRDHHELAGDAPLMELVDRLSTSQILNVGSTKFPDLAKKQRRARKALVNSDLPVLEALIVLLLNTDHAVPSVFVVSYSLAVGSIALN